MPVERSSETVPDDSCVNGLVMGPPSCGTLECDSVPNLVLDSTNIDFASSKPSPDTRDRIPVESHGGSHTKAQRRPATPGAVALLYRNLLMVEGTFVVD